MPLGSLLEQALDCHRGGNLTKAVKLYRLYLKSNKSDGRALHLLGLCYLQQGNAIKAIKPLQRATKLLPAEAANWANLGNAQQALGSLDEAEQSFSKALALNPEDAFSFYNRGNLQRDKDQDQNALDDYRQAIHLKPNFVQAYGNLVELLEGLNQLDEAAELADRGLTHNPRDPLLTLVRARLYRREGNLDGAKARLGGLLDQPLSDIRGAAILYEQGQLFLAQKAYQDAMQAFHQANRVMEATRNPAEADPERYLGRLSGMEKLLDDNRLGDWPRGETGTGEQAPVFLVGFPRSGTTLLDKIMDRFPGIQSVEEKPLLGAVRDALKARKKDSPEALCDLTEAELGPLRDVYWQAARDYGWDGQGILVDKMPLNILEALLILRLWPGARFILAHRHPMDVVLSCYMQAFRLNDAMAHFLTLDRTANLYNRTMAFWQRLEDIFTPNKHVVRYEDLVADGASEGAKMAAFLGVSWDDDFLNVTDGVKARPQRVRTPSYAQVSQPIHQGAVGRWRHFLGDLLAIRPIISPWIEAFGYNSKEQV